MDSLSSISLVTTDGQTIRLFASGFKVDPLRVLLMTEADYLDAMRSIRSGGRMTGRSTAMPLLSSDRPTITLALPNAGQWRIVYQKNDADTLIAEVVS
ncbi:MAG: hypothetical protein JWP89_5461 [Schlesneria sp.]|nr:hypothetical protein [Schlesneria sp.]